MKIDENYDIKHVRNGNQRYVTDVITQVTQEVCGSDIRGRTGIGFSVNAGRRYQFSLQLEKVRLLVYSIKNSSELLDQVIVFTSYLFKV